MELLLFYSLLGLGAMALFGDGDGDGGDGGRVAGNDDDDGGDGDDAPPPAREELRGTDDNDVSSGGQGQLLLGLAGKDTLTGQADAIVHGDGDADIIKLYDSATGYGGDGEDELLADGESRAYGGDGNDRITVDGNASADGEGGDDYLWYRLGDDRTRLPVLIRGGAGADTLVGWSSEAGQVTLAGGIGNDLIIADYGIRAIGSFGEDTLQGEFGSVLTGGMGEDLFIASPHSLSNSEKPITITDFVKGTDRIAFSLDVPHQIELTETDGDTRLTITWEDRGPDRPAQTTVLVKGVTDLTLQDFDFVRPRYEYVWEEYYSKPVFADPLGEIVVGTEGDDQVTAPADRSLVVAGDGNDTVNAGVGTTGGLITLNNGNDRYIATGSLASLSAGAGDDTVDYTSVSNGAPERNPNFRFNPYFSFDLGDGDDQVMIRAAAGTTASQAELELQVNLGAGNDSLSVERDVTRSMSLYDGDGEDVMTFWLGQTAASGLGADRLTLNVAQAHVASRGVAQVYEVSEDDRVIIQLESGITGEIEFVPTDDEDDMQKTTLTVGGTPFAVFGTGLTATDPRITIIRDAVFT